MSFAAVPAMAGDIYVSNQGSDRADGSQQQPLRSLQRALRMAREWRRWGDNRAKGGITVHLDASSPFSLTEPLYLRPEDSGTPDSKTIIRGDGGKAVISGGLPVTSWTQSGDLLVAKAPTIAGKPVITRTLWMDGQRLLRASHCPDGEMERMLEFNTADETITIPSVSLTRFGIRSISDAPQLEMVVHQRWAIAILRVKDITINGDKAVLSFLNPESTWEFSHPWPQPVINGDKGSSGFCLKNARQFLDEPGEWWQDYSTGEIYYRPHEGQTASQRPEALTAIVPVLNRLMTIEGSPAERVHDIVFQDVCFQHAAWQRPLYAGHVTLQGGFPIIDAYKLTEHEGLPWAPTLENQAWVARPEAAVSVTWAERVDFCACEFTHLASTGLDYVDACTDISIKDNAFSDIGGTALLAGSFGEGATEAHIPYREIVTQTANGTKTEVICSRFDINGNTVTDATNDDWGCVGIGCGMVRDFNIHHNTVSHVNYSGICIGWGWTPQDCGMRNNHIHHNTVTNFAQQLYDAGGIYTLSNQPGSTIQHNTISGIGAAPYATNDRAFYVYLDACTDGFTVSDNQMPQFKIGYNTPGPNLIVKE